MTERFNRKLIAPMILGSILNPVNSSMIAVALIPIGAAFGAPPAQTAWLVSGLYLATAIGQPVVGRLIDIFGPRQLFLAGTALTGIAGVVGVLAPSLPVLVIARVILGFGTCAGYPAAMYLIRTEADRTGQKSPAGVLTTLAVASQTIVVIGPTVGGLLIGLGGWRTIFSVNIPLAVAGIVLGLLRLPKTGRRGDGHIDLPGIVLFAGMLTSLLLFLMDPVGEWWLVVVTVVVAAGFAVWERRAAEPFLDLRLLGGNPALLATYVRMLLTAIVSYAFLYGYTQWLEESHGLSASLAGLVLLPLSLTAILVSSATGRNPEVRGKLLVGGACQALACGGLLILHSGSAIWLLIVIGVLVGIPQGLNNLANQNALYHQADPARIASSAGLLRTFFYLGAIISSSANGAFLSERADTPGLHSLAWFMLGASLLMLALTIVDRSLRRIGASTDGEEKPMALTTLDDNTALVLVDLQHGTVSGSRGTPHPGQDVVSRAVELADAFRKHGGPVVLVRVTGEPDGADATPGRTEAGRRDAPPEGWDVIVDELAPQAGDIVVTKRNWGAFHGTDLDLHLRRRGVTQIVLAGVATSIGVESTARAAHEHGYHVTLATDAMTDIDADAHQNSIQRIFPLLGETGTTAEIIELLEKTRSGVSDSTS
ncbi:isochorismatase family protein [Amycolatopsis sp. GM8]|uniref:isochorismatase family protein n=1 Tax=Amycolatopsis sp. GM8 TaxID=2896530 RepID=UPI001EFF7E76|nr:isochorismatase family protein [Amycolatopsis sp. GM8]